MSVLALEKVVAESDHGGKALGLSHALRRGLPVPGGVAVSVEVVEAVVAGQGRAREVLLEAVRRLGAPRLAVRSSAVGEDSAKASFAGQHLTRLNIESGPAVFNAVVEVRNSGRTEAALAYRRRLGITAPPRVAVVIQRMVDPECAGVMFTRDPRTGTDHRLIEGTWGLGEAVVAGLVTPDRVVMARGGKVIEHSIGHKDLAVRFADDGGVREVPVPDELAQRTCLSARRLDLLEDLASRCEDGPDGAHDIEWAFDDRGVHLLQRRAVTT